MGLPLVGVRDISGHRGDGCRHDAVRGGGVRGTTNNPDVCTGGRGGVRRAPAVEDLAGRTGKPWRRCALHLA
ncbi:hypothetical protein ABZ749_10165 [Micromonospora sp. NPDC047753]|uniref:hypothetical protein n=1 Tax=Micromonospora sp. NPDC047753 TaxID=3154817 RepID=UPI003406C4B7